MENRIGSTRQTKRARLVGYRLAFNKRGNDETGKANIVADAKSTVWGVIYRCTPQDLRQLDKYEGVRDGHYVQTRIQVCVEGGEKVDAVTYVAGDSFFKDALVPSKEYLETILRGARHHGLPEEYIHEIERKGA